MAINERRVKKEVKKKKQTKFSKEEKLRREELYEKHSVLFHLIFKIGNKVMLETQLIALCRKLGFIEYSYSDSSINKILKEMKDLKMIEVNPWQANKRCNMIQLCDPFLKRSADYFTELLGYPHGKALDVNEGLFKNSICRTEYIITILHPNVRVANDLYTAEDFFRYVDYNYSLYYQRGRGLEYLKKINDKYGNELKIKKEEFKEIIHNNATDYNNLVARNGNATITAVSNKYTGGEGTFIEILQQAVNIRIDIFDINDRRQIDDLLESASKTIDCFNKSLEKRFKLHKTNKCEGCPKEHSCLRPFDATAGEYQKLEINCTERPFILDRAIHYTINIYAYEESGFIKIRKDINESKVYRSGEKSDFSPIEHVLSKATGVDFNHIKVNIKNLDIDRKYKKGKRGDKFDEINRERAIANTVEAVVKTEKKYKISEKGEELIRILYTLPKDIEKEVSEALVDTLNSSLKTLLDEINKDIEKDI